MMKTFKHITLFFFFYLSSILSVQAEPLDKIVAIVNDGVITKQELAQQVAIIARQIQQQQNVSQISPELLEKQVLQRMIDVELQLQLAKMNGVSISDQQLNTAIKNIATKHKVSLAEMKKSILAEGISWKKYRSDIRKELLLAKLQQESVGEITVTDTQVEEYIKANKKNENTQYHLQDILLSLPEAPSSEILKKKQLQANDLINKLRKGADFSKAAVEFSNNEMALKGGDLGFRTLAALPKMFSKQVVSMKAGEIAGPLRAPNGLHIIKLVATKGQEQAKRYVTLTRVKHILLKVGPGVPSEQVETKIKNLALQIKRGRKFEDIAKNFSDDIGSAKQGGDLGWVHKGETVPEFEKTFQKLKEGQVSQPVKSGFGWHIIMVVGRKKVDDSVAYQKQQVRQALFHRKFQEAVANWLQQLKAGSYVQVTL